MELIYAIYSNREGWTGVHGASQKTPWTWRRAGGAPQACRMIQEERMRQTGRRRCWRGMVEGDRGAGGASGVGGVRRRAVGGGWEEEARTREELRSERTVAKREKSQSKRRVKAREGSKQEKGRSKRRVEAREEWMPEKREKTQ
ncbi:hypothetical protein JB92DRAFT_2836121 [Gautieria morchelliformis]|nr:hypothetical protein JB92DRAFT_2836121 [Gautieria morchelliformis]